MRALQTGDHRNACVKILRHRPIHATFWVSPTNKQRGIRGGGPRRRFRSGGIAYDGRLCLLGEAMLEEDTTERLVEEPCNPPPGGGLMIVVCRLCILLVAGTYKK